jgi:hypothetical protein
MELILFWLLCGFASSVVAGAKNRSAFGWFFGGLLLGPIGLLMVGFMPVLKENEAIKDTRLCPFCAEEIQPAAIVCKHCGRQLNEDEGALYAAAREAKRQAAIQDQKNGMMALGLILFVVAGVMILYGVLSR